MRSFAPIGLLVLPGALLGAACKKDDDEDLAPVDALDPSLVVISPAPAAWLPEGPTPVTGVAEDVRAVQIDGVPATLGEGGTFAGQAVLERGMNLVEVRATTVDGDDLYVRHGVIAGDFDPAEGAVEDAAIVRLNRGGLDRLLGMVGGLLDAATLNESLAGMNPIYEDSYGIWGWDAVTITAVVDSVSFGTLALAADPGAGEIVLSGSIPDLFVDAQAYGDVVGIDFDSDVTMWADEAEISGTLTLGAEDGMITVELSDLSLDLIGFGYDTSLLPGDIESYLLVDTLRGTIEEQVVAMVQEQVPAMVDEALAGLELSFETEILSTPLSVGAFVDRVDVDGDGVELGLDLDVAMPDGGVTGEGVLGSEGGAPTVDRAADLAAAISDDLLNRMLYEAWSGGLLEMTLSTADGSLDGFLLKPLHASEGSIAVSAKLPPVIVQADETQGGGLQLQVAELIVDIDTPDGELGQHLQLAVALQAGIDLAYEDGEIELDIGETAVGLMVRESDWGSSNEAVTQLVEEMLPLDTLLLLVGALSFPVPSIEGLTLAGVDIGRDHSGVHTSLTADLE